MAGHSHWAGIKHKKGRQDKQRSNLFSKLSREITVAAKLGSKDPNSNPRLRTAIQSAKESNMPKDNIERAIKKSSTEQSSGYQSFRYEGFGPFNVAFIIETLTDNKNRSASVIRTIFQKNGGRLGESGSTTHLFFNCGIIQIQKEKCSEEEIFELAINSGAMDCLKLKKYHEIVCKKEDFYKVKSELEKKFQFLNFAGIEWRPFNLVGLNKEQNEKIVDIFEALDEQDDVQNVFTNANLDSTNL